MPGRLWELMRLGEPHQADPQQEVHDLQVIMATPGRLWELMRLGEPHLADLSRVAFLVLDEADRMVQQGHFQVSNQPQEPLEYQGNGSLVQNRKHPGTPFLVYCLFALTDVQVSCLVMSGQRTSCQSEGFCSQRCACYALCLALRGSIQQLRLQRMLMLTPLLNCRSCPTSWSHLPASGPTQVALMRKLQWLQTWRKLQKVMRTMLQRPL